MLRGLQLATRKYLTRAASIALAPVPDTLILPLDQHADTPLETCVAVGDRVLLGQVIARSTRLLGAALHSPVAGHVQAVEHRSTAAIVLHNDHSDAADPTHHPYAWQHHTAAELCKHLARGGIVGLGGAVFSTAMKLADCEGRVIEQLLINGMECEPYITCDDHLMRERATDILQGVRILLHACQASHATIAIESDKPEALRAMRTALSTAGGIPIDIVSLPTAYPHGDEGQLIKQLFNKEIPRGKLPVDIGVIVHNVGTAYAAAQWAIQARPLISRVITLTGQGVKTPRNLEVRLGTRCADLIAACDGYAGTVASLIVGGPMMGNAVPDDDFPIVKASNCLIAATHHELRSPPIELPCIRCGECSTLCPVHLLPQQLFTHLRHDNTEAAVELGLFDCIECGCCDFVCPSQISLASRFRMAKQRIRTSD